MDVAIVIGRAVVVVLLFAPADVVLFFLLDRGVARDLCSLVMISTSGGEGRGGTYGSRGEAKAEKPRTRVAIAIETFMLSDC